MQFKSNIDVKVIGEMGSDAMIASAAWVCTSAEEGMRRAAEKPDDVRGLIRHLMKHRHGSPFEHSAITFYVRAPIFVWREWHRHRIGFSYNEQSARYQKLEPVFYVPEFERPMVKVDGWKPGRPKFKTLLEAETEAGGDEINARLRYDAIDAMMRTTYMRAYEAYEQLLRYELDPGLARDVLPVGIYSACYVSCNPRSLMHFLSLRHHDPAATYVSYPLWEIDLAAQACEEVLRMGWPITHAAFVEGGRVGP